MTRLQNFTTGLWASLAVATAPMAVAADNDKDRDPQKKLDGSWITISGTVTTTDSDSFRLDYGSGLITVEMDDWDWYEEDREVLSGDRVIVYGDVDKDTYEAASIEASSVYVESLGTYFYASSADEEGRPFTFNRTPDARVTLGDMVVTGVVSSVGTHEFTIDTGKRRLTVETTPMPYNPLDSEGTPQIAIGDRVSATGVMTKDTFEKAELEAESVVLLQDESSKPPIS